MEITQNLFPKLVLELKDFKKKYYDEVESSMKKSEIIKRLEEKNKQQAQRLIELENFI